MLRKQKLKEVSEKPIQGLYSSENPNGSYWFLKSKVTLAVFREKNSVIFSRDKTKGVIRPEEKKV